MSTYQTYILSCDFCAKVFADPVVAYATHIRERAEMFGWRSVHSPLPPELAQRGRHLYMRRGLQYQIDFCPCCAINLEGVFPLDPQTISRARAVLEEVSRCHSSPQ